MWHVLGTGFLRCRHCPIRQEPRTGRTKTKNTSWQSNGVLEENGSSQQKKTRSTFALTLISISLGRSFNIESRQMRSLCFADSTFTSKPGAGANCSSTARWAPITYEQMVQNRPPDPDAARFGKLVFVLFLGLRKSLCHGC